MFLLIKNCWQIAGYSIREGIMDKHTWIARVIFVAFCLVLLAGCKSSDFSLEQCAIQLVEEKYYLEQSDMKITPMTADQVRIEGWAYECGSIEEMCRPGDEIGFGSGSYGHMSNPLTITFSSSINHLDSSRVFR